MERVHSVYTNTNEQNSSECSHTHPLRRIHMLKCVLALKFALLIMICLVIIMNHILLYKYSLNLILIVIIFFINKLNINKTKNQYIDNSRLYIT